MNSEISIPLDHSLFSQSDIQSSNYPIQGTGTIEYIQEEPTHSGIEDMVNQMTPTAATTEIKLVNKWILPEYYKNCLFSGSFTPYTNITIFQNGQLIDRTVYDNLLFLEDFHKHKLKNFIGMTTNLCLAIIYIAFYLELMINMWPIEHEKTIKIWVFLSGWYNMWFYYCVYLNYKFLSNPIKNSNLSTYEENNFGIANCMKYNHFMIHTIMDGAWTHLFLSLWLGSFALYFWSVGDIVYKNVGILYFCYQILIVSIGHYFTPSKQIYSYFEYNKNSLSIK
jgi:hypothetical protein